MSESDLFAGSNPAASTNLRKESKMSEILAKLKEDLKTAMKIEIQYRKLNHLT
jgi:hypothetical protein